MYEGYSPSILCYGCQNSDVTFLDPENALLPFSHMEGLLFLEIKISNFVMFCDAEALNFSLNRNLVLVIKHKSVQDPKKVQN